MRGRQDRGRRWTWLAGRARACEQYELLRKRPQRVQRQDDGRSVLSSSLGVEFGRETNETTNESVASPDSVLN